MMKTSSIAAKVLTIIILSFTLLISRTDSQLWPRAPPLAPSHFCISQLLVANDACSRLPVDQVRTSPPLPTPPQPNSINDGRHRHGHHHRHDRHHHGHGDEEWQDQPNSVNDEHRHGHHHSHRHHQQHGQEEWQELPAEQDCCKWAKEVDPECVCGMLAYLPVFLAKPLHTYTVIVDPVCNVTFACGARVFG